ncbi:YeiH family protein [Clostridium sp.]|uniref:YeiH family protein n=1 Tax=Clostridium sp. TaxID=1506 RepID=UPI003F3010FF
MSKHNLTTKKKIVDTIPGMLICVAIAILSKMLAVFVPSLGAATLSIFIGILVGNTFGNKPFFHRGTKFCEGTLLSISVVLLGATLSVSSILHIGIMGILFIILQMIITTAGTIFIGRKMKFSEDFTLLMASGNAVCGSSAIASTAPVINAHSKDKGISITMVNVTGTVLMILLPLITSFLYNNEVFRTSAFLGGILQSVGQVVASASIVSEEVKELATIFKIVRIIFLVGVVFALAAIKNKNATKAIDAVEHEVHSNTHQSRIKMPWYIKGFFITCALYSLSIIPSSWAGTLKEIDNFIEIIALAGIGMRVYFADLVKQGVKTSVYCLFIGLLQITSAIILIALVL